MLRGSITQVQLFEMFLHTQMWRWDREILNKDGTRSKKPKYHKGNLQGVLRKIPFGYEYIFPKEHLAEVLTMLDAKNNGTPWSLGLKMPIIRKIMGHGIKKIPKYKEVPTNRYVEKRGVALYFIGIKHDIVKNVPEWGFRQEML